VLVIVGEEADPVDDADPSVLRGVHVVVALAHAANSSVQDGPCWRKVLVQLHGNLVEGLQQASEEGHLAAVPNAQGTEELHVLLVGRGGDGRHSRHGGHAGGLGRHGGNFGHAGGLGRNGRNGGHAGGLGRHGRHSGRDGG